MNQDDRPLPPEAIEALERGEMIQAIKIVRETYGLGLRESKDLVDRHVESDPALREKMKSRQISGFGCLLGLGIVAVIAMAIYFAFFRK